MRSMSYKLELDRYVVEIDEELIDEDADVDEPLMRLTHFAGLDGEVIPESEYILDKSRTDIVSVTDSILDCYKEVLAGKTEYFLVRVALIAATRGVALSFANHDDNEVMIAAFGRKGLGLEFEYDRGKGKEPDRYKVFPRWTDTTDPNTGVAYRLPSFQVVERRGDATVLSFGFHLDPSDSSKHFAYIDEYHR